MDRMVRLTLRACARLRAAVANCSADEPHRLTPIARTWQRLLQLGLSEREAEDVLIPVLIAVEAMAERGDPLAPDLLDARLDALPARLDFGLPAGAWQT